VVCPARLHPAEPAAGDVSRQPATLVDRRARRSSGDPSECSRRPMLLHSRDRSTRARDGCVPTVDRMQRGQSTVEYLALVLLVLVAACALVRFHTPVEGMAVAR